MDIKRLQYFAKNIYRNYYKNSIGKDIVIHIPNIHANDLYFWRSEYNLKMFGRDIVEVHFYSNNSEKISEEQKKLFNSFLKNLDKLKLYLEKSLLEIPIEKSTKKNDLIISVDIYLKTVDKLSVEIWSSIDKEHPIIDNEIIDLSVEEINDWGNIDDQKAISLITEILNDITNYTKVKLYGEALEKKYSKVSGWIIDIIFNEGIDNSEVILKRLKENEVIQL